MVSQSIKEYSNDIPNVLTRVPQDIKMELGTNTVILKAGSRINVPIGNGNYEVVEINSDLTSSNMYKYSTGKHIIYYCPTLKTFNCLVYVTEGNNRSIYCQDTEPTPNTSIATVWYDTKNEIFKVYNLTREEWIPIGLPCGYVSWEQSGDGETLNFSDFYTFNGCGYMLNLVWICPGVAGNYPDGRDEDGVAIVRNVESDKIITRIIEPYTWGRNVCSIYLYDEDTISITDEENRMYDEQLNINCERKNNLISLIRPDFPVGQIVFDYENNEIKSVTPYCVGRPLSIASKSVYNSCFPSDKWIELPKPTTTRATVTMPHNGWFYIEIESRTTLNYVARLNVYNDITHFGVSDYFYNGNVQCVLPVGAKQKITIDMAGFENDWECRDCRLILPSYI